MQRRSFLQTLVSSVAFLAAGFGRRIASAESDLAKDVFACGVASGDPTADAVVLWTRIATPGNSTLSKDLRWQVATDAAMTDVVAAGMARTDESRDFTVKVDATGLPSGRTVYYRFDVDGHFSPVGRTRTLPTGDLRLAKFAVVSCSNHPAGYFHAYREIAQQDDIDAVLHLGDYIYEYGMGGYATDRAGALGRIPDPATECLTLTDYRRRHAQYKQDADSRAMLAAHPLIAVWDDHETANDAWRDGAQNHQPDEGKWTARRDAAMQAWFEWMPIRNNRRNERRRRGVTPIFRDFRYGNLASVVMLDTRLYGRDAQANVSETVSEETVTEAMRDAKRRMLGSRQERWLRQRLQASGDTVWQIIGQQVMVANMRSPDLEPVVNLDGPSYFSREALETVVARSKGNPPGFLDTWDGYPHAREDLLQDLSQYARNPVLLSGDLHTALAAELIPAGAEKPVAVEFMTTSVSSPGIAAYLPEKSPDSLRDATLEQNPGIRFLDIHHRGWLCLTVTPQRCTGAWHFLSTVHDRDYHSELARSFWVAADRVVDGLHG
ncbi:MAG: alkaline phosphatase D family protein [Woeseia sp.]